MNKHINEAFWDELQKIAEARAGMGVQMGPGLDLPKYPWKSILAGAAGTAVGAGTGTLLVRLLQEKTNTKYPPLKYLGPLTMAVGGALFGASAMQARAEKEHIDAFRAAESRPASR